MTDDYLNSKFPGGLNRGKACLVFVLGSLEKLRELGLVDAAPGAMRLGPRGWPLYEALCAMDFRPTPAEIEDVMVFIQSNPSNP